MSILASLAKAYDRLPSVPPLGFSTEKIGFVISLNEDGSVASVTDLRDGTGRKRAPRLMQVPQPVKRTVAIAPNFLWDKTSYVLGVTAGEGKRTAEEHAAFIQRHRDTLLGTADSGLLALLHFLDNWSPEQFAPPFWPEEMKDQNVIFALESERRQDVYLHDRPAARALWADISAGNGEAAAVCLVTGAAGPIARLHPAIKGVWGAQSSGASIVSFNLDAFTSYGHEQGENAPVSEAAAFKYTTALNTFLADDRHRIQIGDASTVFWADAADAHVAEVAESFFNAWFDPQPDEGIEAGMVGEALGRMRRGIPLRDIEPKLAEGVRFYVLGLAPNAARISIRFWLEDDFGRLAANYARFVSDMAIEPPPRDGYPPLWRYLAETAVLGKRENVPPNLAGEWMRAILTGTPYPLTLLATVLMRIRADGEINALRAGMLRAVLVRNFGMDPARTGTLDKAKEAPVSLDPNNRSKGYLLGRLFAAYEQAQLAALGRTVNATIKDKFYGAASAQPRKVFALLEKGSANHLSKIGKQRPGQRFHLERIIGSILEAMDPSDDPFPASLPAAEQALFGLGYYHQRNEFFRKPETLTEEAAQ
ncbi:type I-C CRISPR-associated protein Cas8c/Csd1 [Chelatococcus sp. SYSU_G07232]|uniref:Type I-C CRISPR-associated protein Cas8c/Csd1 n=1 Tax=Chelatococcus albus TaxID=3047466 RepID=A0ABT7AFS4_9HYPH|nr:type I-C CRISPR-associated protein Cas8c/Csd1 [Chelatococcus sp. SYSU_G07232]MDJ1158220.1 type I-C CRISPR-associated protein Cas8c/Csd1 [Chelatococcus sp. SYSU_G07232]